MAKAVRRWAAVTVYVIALLLTLFALGMAVVIMGLEALGDRIDDGR